jgi:hypothetical protein
LKAGVMEEGQWYRPESGSPQGGVISPLLANLYLHHVLDSWFTDEVQPLLIGRSFLLRYADDATLVFANERDARRVWEVLAKRLAGYGLELHPTKTRLVYFRPPRGGRESESFDLLGFTHYWGKSRKNRWMIKRKTAKDRFRRGLGAIGQWCRINRHRPLREQHAVLSRKLRGHYGYFGLSGNLAALKRLRFFTERVWVKWLRRRSQRGRRLNWEKAEVLLKVFALPQPRVRRFSVS